MEHLPVEMRDNLWLHYRELGMTRASTYFAGPAWYGHYAKELGRWRPRNMQKTINSGHHETRKPRLSTMVGGPEMLKEKMTRLLTVEHMKMINSLAASRARTDEEIEKMRQGKAGREESRQGEYIDQLQEQLGKLKVAHLRTQKEKRAQETAKILNSHLIQSELPSPGQWRDNHARYTANWNEDLHEWYETHSRYIAAWENQLETRRTKMDTLGMNI